MMLIPIGGDFHSGVSEPFFTTGDAAADLFPDTMHYRRGITETATDSFAMILMEMAAEIKSVCLWIPAHYCFETVARLVKKVDTTLQIETYVYKEFSDLSFNSNINNVLVLNHFNGFDETLAAAVQAYKNAGWLVVEDFVHAPLDIAKATADYSFNSLRKLSDVEVSVYYSPKTKTVIRETPDAYLNIKKEAADLKAAFLKNGDTALESRYLDLFKKAEALLFSKGARIYLLLEGDVALTVAGKPLELVLPGEIFGEMAAIAETPRSATATARKNCRVLSLDEKQFLQSLQRMPEFALMLMSVMAQRLRRSLARLAGAKKASVEVLEHKNTLDKKMIAELHLALGEPTPATAAAGRIVVTQGAVGACMFVVTEGRIAISVDGAVIEHVGPGGVFGEMALVDRSGRSATATAEIDSAWMLIGRKEFVAMVKSRPAFGIAFMRSMSARVLHLGKVLTA